MTEKEVSEGMSEAGAAAGTVVTVDWQRIMRLVNAVQDAMAEAIQKDPEKGAKKIEVTMAMMAAGIMVIHSLLDEEDKAKAAKEFRNEANWMAAEWAAGNIPINVVKPAEAP